MCTFIQNTVLVTCSISVSSFAIMSNISQTSQIELLTAFQAIYYQLVHNVQVAVAGNAEMNRLAQIGDSIDEFNVQIQQVSQSEYLYQILCLFASFLKHLTPMNMKFFLQVSQSCKKKFEQPIRLITPWSPLYHRDCAYWPTWPTIHPDRSRISPLGLFTSEYIINQSLSRCWQTNRVKCINFLWYCPGAAQSFCLPLGE